MRKYTIIIEHAGVEDETERLMRAGIETYLDAVRAMGEPIPIPATHAAEADMRIPA